MRHRVVSVTASTPSAAMRRRGATTVALTTVWAGLLVGCSSGSDGAGSDHESPAGPQGNPTLACELLGNDQASDVLGGNVSGEPGGPYGGGVIARCEWEQPEDSGLGILLTVSEPDQAAFLALRDDLTGWEPVPDLDDDAYVWSDSTGQDRSMSIWFAGALTDPYALQVIVTGPNASREQATSTLDVVLTNLGDEDAIDGAAPDPPSSDPSDLESCKDAAQDEGNPTNAVGEGRHPLIETGIRARWTSTDERDADIQARQLAARAEVGVIVQAEADDVLVTILDQVPDRDPELGCFSDILSLAGWERSAVETIEFVSYGVRLDIAGVAAEFPGELSENDARQICETAREDGATGCVAGTSDTGDGAHGVVQLYGVESTNSVAYLKGLLPPGVAGSPDIYFAAISTAAIPGEGQR